MVGMVQPNLSDRDIAEDLLSSEKYVSDLYAKATLEATDPRLRSTFQQLHSEAQNAAKHAFDYLNSKGWYQPRRADPQTLTNLKSSADEIRRSVSQSAQAQAQTQQPGYSPQYQQQYAGAQQQYATGYGQQYQQQHTAGYPYTAAQQYPRAQQQYGAGYGQQAQNLPSWAYREPTWQQFGYGPGEGTIGSAQHYSPARQFGATQQYGTGMAQQYGAGYGQQAQNLPSWAYREPTWQQFGYGPGEGTIGSGFTGGYAQQFRG